jgi:hypothetical protein
MTPEDVAAVQRSWSELRGQRAELRAALTRQFQRATGSPVPLSIPASTRADWLLRAVAELVDLLPAPSRLAERARAFGTTWPDPHVAPCFATEGVAWLTAADECHPAWSPVTEAAWRQAWLLLSDVLAAEALSPFADVAEPRPTARDT